MSEIAKICIIYRDKAPQFLNTDDPAALSWSIEFLDAGKIFSGPVAPRSDIIAVFCPAGDEILELPERVAHLFPGAALVAYLDSDGRSGPPVSNENYFLPTVQLPMREPF